MMRKMNRKNMKTRKTNRIFNSKAEIVDHMTLNSHLIASIKSFQKICKPRMFSLQSQLSPASLYQTIILSARS